MIIARGLATFIEVGTALIEVNDERLYRVEFETFEDYLATLDISRSYGYDLMRSAATVSAIADTDLRPKNEGQARALAPLRDHPEKMREVMAEVFSITDGRPTAKAIREVVADSPEIIHPANRHFDGVNWIAPANRHRTHRRQPGRELENIITGLTVFEKLINNDIRIEDLLLDELTIDRYLNVTSKTIATLRRLHRELRAAKRNVVTGGAR